MCERDQVRSRFGIYATSWNNELGGSLERWKLKCTTLVAGMIACSMCGNVAFNSGSCLSDLQYTTMLPVVPHAPAILANMHLRDHAVAAVTVRRPEVRWHVCKLCKKDAWMSKYLVHHTPLHMCWLLKTPPMEIQMLSLLEVSAVMEARYRGFAHGALEVNSLLRHPLVSWNPNDDTSNFRPSAEVQELLSFNLRSNPLIQRYKCMMEQNDPTLGLPLVPKCYVEHIVDNAIARGPRLVTETNPVPFVLSTVVDVPVPMVVEGEAAPATDPVKAGDLHLRAAYLESRWPLMTLPGQLTSDSDNSITVEKALFPFLFPHGDGAFDGRTTLNTYLRMRMLQAFSVFTLFKPYLLLMFQIRQAVMLHNNVKSMVLSRSLVDFKSRNPLATDAQAMANAIKWNVPSSMPGTPAYHRHQLQDLLCRVDTWGLPDFFLTLTADEVSECRFEEINELDDFMRRFGASLNWEDAPVECSRLFLARYKAFMNDWVLGASSKQILGRVQHHVTRIEVQHRGSLHVHILLWVHPDDVARVADEIMAYVPACYNTANQSFVPPDMESQPLEHQLYKIVLRKHMHKCTTWKGKADGCRDEHGKCKMLFPFSVSSTLGTTFDRHIMRYVYCRPRESDGYVIPFHPTVALVWNASTNIQRITGSAWSFYVLKYAMKSEPLGNMSLGPEVAQALHLQDMSTDQLRLVSNMVLAKPVSPAEAAVLMLQHPLVEVSRGDCVTYICSTLPDKRASMLKNSKACTHPIDKYCQRPSQLSDGTGELIGVDMGANHVYKLKEPRLVRFSDYDPSKNSEGFFFQLLLDAITFDVEIGIISIGNLAETPYFYECIIRGVFTNMEELQVHLDAYAKLHLYDEQYRMAMYEQLMQSLQGLRTGPLSDMFDFSASELSGSPVRVAAPHMRGIEALSEYDTANLTREQDGIVTELMQRPKGLHCISGVPGSGKSFLIKCIPSYSSRPTYTKLLPLL